MKRRLDNTKTATATATKGNQPPQHKQQRRGCHKRAPLTPGCFPNTDVSRGYIAVKDFHRFFPGAVPECCNNGSSNREESKGRSESESSVLQVPPELDISELRPITYKDYITQTIQESLVKPTTTLTTVAYCFSLAHLCILLFAPNNITS